MGDDNSKRQRSTDRTPQDEIRGDMMDAKMFGGWVAAAQRHEQQQQQGISAAERHANGLDY